MKNNIRFQPSLRRAEDIRFNVDFMKVAKSFMVIPDLYYDYNCSNPNQISRSNKSSKPTIQSLKFYYQHIVDGFDDLLLQAEYYNAAQEVKYTLCCDFYKKCKILFDKLDNLKMGSQLINYIQHESHFVESKSYISTKNKMLISISLKLNDILACIKRLVKNMIKT